MVEMREQVSLSGSFCSSIQFTREPRMLCNVGTVWFSITNVGWDFSGDIRQLMRRSLSSSASLTDCSRILILALFIFGHMSAKAFAKVLYTVVWQSSMDETWSSKMFSTVSMLAKNFFVLSGRLVAVVTGISIRAWGVVFVIVLHYLSESPQVSY